MLVRAFLGTTLIVTFAAFATAADKVANEPDRKAVADFSYCAKPDWPKWSLVKEQTGTVTFDFLIGADGWVQDAVVRKSSGYALLDAATLIAVKKCKFKPGIKDGKPVTTWMSMQYVWSLE